MNLIQEIINNVKENMAEYYTLFVLVLAIPTVIGSLLGFNIGLFTSFVIQATIGVSYIKGKGNVK